MLQRLAPSPAHEDNSINEVVCGYLKKKKKRIDSSHEFIILFTQLSLQMSSSVLISGSISSNSTL